MDIISREALSTGIYKISVTDGGTFFIRPDYLITMDVNTFLFNDSFEGEAVDDILEAGMITAVEYKAVDYLARSEHCRFALNQKLSKKGYEKRHIEKALDYLEKINYLSDSRFCASWLNMRKINHYEGRIKLSNELASRGISRDVISESLDKFFIENDEESIAVKAYEKLVKKGKSGDKLTAALINAGFSYKLIRQIEKTLEERRDFPQEPLF